MAFKPFYVHLATVKAIERCVWKKQPHTRSSISALIENAQKQNIDLSFSDYDEFFKFLANDCRKEETPYISWNSTPDKYTVCQQILSEWECLKSPLIQKDDKTMYVQLQH